MNHHHIIKQAIVTEKSLSQGSLNRYTFLVDKRASKHQIKAAIESLFSVNVVNVNTLLTKGIEKRTGRRRLPTTTPLVKKAIVELKQGQSIKSINLKG